MASRRTRTWSRRLSYLLRHNPAAAGLDLTDDGWVSELELLARVEGLTRDLLEDVLAADDKGRFARNQGRVRAVHGHTAGVAAAAHTVAQDPPPVLYHGTSRTAAALIDTAGLTPRTRQHVHLSADPDAAREVGARRGTEPVIFTVDTGAASAAGVRFYPSGNGIWLADPIPAPFLTRTDRTAGAADR